MHRTEVAIVGAGPYGLSIAAHLRNAGVPFRIVGRAMETWLKQMPEGMLLKSDGFASDLSDPNGTFRLHHYCSEKELTYHATRVPVKLSTFANYGVEFQQRMVPELEDAKLVELRRGDGEFVLKLDNGDSFIARRVVLAVGISHYAHVPSALSGLTSPALVHASQVTQPADYAGKRIVVIGGGASAIDLAALLHEAGADVTIAARRSKLSFHSGPRERERTMLEKLQKPGSGIGPGWKLRLLTEFPHLYRFLPTAMRLRALTRLLGPSAGWPMRARVEGKVPTLCGVTPKAAQMRGDKVLLSLAASDGSLKQMEVDHVIASTGYHTDLSRLPFLDKNLVQQIRSIENMPVLSGHFESSVPGLYFVGLSSALTFGPMMRFAFGSAYTARRLERHLLRRSKRRSYYEERATATA